MFQTMGIVQSKGETVNQLPIVQGLEGLKVYDEFGQKRSLEEARRHQ